MLDVTSSFLSLTPAVSLYYGFIGGVVSAGIGAGLINLGYNASFVQPERVYRQALKLVSRHDEIKERLGGKPLTVIDTKSYNSVLGMPPLLLYIIIAIHCLFYVLIPMNICLIVVFVPFIIVFRWLGHQSWPCIVASTYCYHVLCAERHSC